jgi:putative SbcD/Mre11-related phosphoesterase
VRFRDRALVVDESLVVADLHVGKDASSNVEARLGEHADLTERMGALLDDVEPSELVVAGDLLHTFGELPRGTMETLTALHRHADDVGADVVVTPGNHDAMLQSLWDGPTPDEYRLSTGGEDAGDVVVCHGHEVPDADADVYVVGHEHPTIEIEGQRRPCYLHGEGTFRGADVVMLPAFTRLAAGVVVNGMVAADFQSPLVRDADAFRPVVRDADAGETLTFPPLGEFRRLL